MAGAFAQLASLVPERWRYWARRRAVLVVLTPVGLIGLYSGLGWAPLLLVIGSAIALGVLARFSEFFRALGLVLGTIAVPWLCLLGFNVLLQIPRLLGSAADLGLAVGLVIGVIVFTLVAARLLVLWHDRVGVALATGFALAVLNLVVPPWVIGSREPPQNVKRAQDVVFQLDASIVVPGSTGERVAEIDEELSSPDWDVRFSVARATPGGSPQWLVLDTDDAGAARAAALGRGAPKAGKPTRREGADQLVLLDVDGTPPVTPRPWELREQRNGEIESWMRTVARVKVPDGTPVVALLQTTDENRRRAWNTALRRYGGFALSVQRRRARSITDAAVHAAIAAPTADEDLALALRFRPLLLFSSNAKRGNDTPLDVDALLREANVELCHEDRLKGTNECKRVSRAAALINGDRHLRVPKEARQLDLPTRIYVHPTRVTSGPRDLLYLDYWWYLLSNPNEVGLGGFCGAGLSLPGITCFAHASDWEGVTVVVDLTSGEAKPVAVHYAQHSDVIRYSFAQLRDNDWAEHDIRVLLHDVGVKSVDTQDRPLVFVASGSHASYPTPCRKDCRQLASEGTGEDRHDGRHMPTWSGNDANLCAADCVRLTPTRANGSLPALWNAFEGVWGERSCILLGYCTAERSPAAPGTQRRYMLPARISGFVDEHGTFSKCRAGGAGGEPACPPLPAAG